LPGLFKDAQNRVGPHSDDQQVRLCDRPPEIRLGNHFVLPLQRAQLVRVAVVHDDARLVARQT